MKAHIKINITIQFDGEGPHDGTKFPLSAHQAGVIEVADIAEGERVVGSLGNHISSMFTNMSVKPVPSGSHKPDLGAAFGGLPEKNGNGVGA